jgi:hypothetical protein
VYRPSYCVLLGLSVSQANSSLGCQETNGFTGPAETCTSGGPFGQAETSVALSLSAWNTDWEDPCSG